MPELFLNCSYASVCSGCDWLLRPPSEQRLAKVAALRAAWPDAPASIGFRSLAESAVAGGFAAAGAGAGARELAGGTRDRVDLMISRDAPVATPADATPADATPPGADTPAQAPRVRIGLFDKFKTGLVDLQGCPQMSPALEAWFAEFRRYDFGIARGSVRLRVSPQGARGVWLDFANVDIKTLLDDGRVLRELLQANVTVEIGQRRKRLVERDGKLKLDDPVFAPWFETYVDGTATPLYCTIGSFTQPGFRVNRLLVDEVMSLVDRGKRAAEFGAGIGNFTLPLAARFDHVDAYEVDSLALEGLKLVKPENVTIHEGNFQGAKAAALDFSNVDCLLVDPPRSGLMNFLEPLAEAQPKTLLYVSCFAESFAQDAAKLKTYGYSTKHASIVDQFPQSKHYEIVALFTC